MDARTEASWLLAVMAGGAVGSAARYAVSRAASQYAPGAIEAFPWHTFGINVVGSFLLGLATVWYRNHPQPIWLLLLGTGFCGGFTTFSTFSVETLRLVERHSYFGATLYAFGSVWIGFLAALGAVRLAKLVATAEG